MPYSNDFFPDSSMTQYLPGTPPTSASSLVTHSFSERLMGAEFDDALVDQAPWKNPRYDGSKITGKEINKFTPVETVGIGTAEITVDFIIGGYQKDGWLGDKTGQLGDTPVINNETTALYIANTVIGGTEDPQFATIKGHSYVGINKMLLINPSDDSVTIIDRAVEPFEEFHRFVTNDFHTGTKCKVKIIDESIGTNLKGDYRVKMNKGYLLKTFSFDQAGEFSGSLDPAHSKSLLDNNSMYLYTKGNFRDNFIVTGSTATGTVTAQEDQLRFRYGVVEMFNAGTSSGHHGHLFDHRRIGPLFVSASIHENKFTQEYYTGSYGFIKHQTEGVHIETQARMLGASGLGSASRFMGIDTLSYLSERNTDPFLTEQEKTEVHVTFFKGTKDFAPNQHDERSIGTFEVDGNKAQLGIEQGDSCNDGLPTNHELVFKGRLDNRFLPKIDTFVDTLQNAHLQLLSTDAGCAPTGSLQGTVDGDGVTTATAATLGTQTLIGSIQAGVTVDKVEDFNCYVQGGALGVIGYIGANSASLFNASNPNGTPNILSELPLDSPSPFVPGAGGGGLFDPPAGTLIFPGYGEGSDKLMKPDNFYTGSFNYELSFLDKDHTLVLNLDKPSELFDGIGEKGLVIVPQDCLPKIKNNIEFYLEKAGIIENTTNTQQNLG